MKFVFLDIDGVLNHQSFYEKRHLGLLNLPEHPLNEFCPDAVENLNQLISDTGAKIVISSTWRLGQTVAELNRIFKEVGCKSEIFDKTPDLRRDNSDCIFRGNEIYKWLSDHRDLLGSELHKFKGYCILDDDSDMLFWQRNNFILVDHFVGLTKGTVFQATKILEGWN